MKSETVLSVQELRLDYETLLARTHALNGVDLEVQQGEVVGVVGESGSGKSSLALAIIGLLPSPPARILAGSRISFKGQDLLAMRENQLEGIRGTGISMIFQEPLTSLNPIFTIGDQVAESVRVSIERRARSEKPTDMKEEIRRETISWLGRVGLPDPASTMQRYPHELSGGMRQRAMIAMALAARPSMILADEPTSALDVTTQAQILKLMRSLIEEVGTSVLFISHDLAVVAQVADRAAVMYAGMVVEEAHVSELFENPLHPYTRALLGSLPRDDSRGRLEAIPGSVPNLANIPSGCPFHPRCSFAKDVCSQERPMVREASPGHRVACVLY